MDKTKLIKTLSENDRVIKFISEFKAKNEYNAISKDPYNEKFKIEFNDFLDKGNFSAKTLTLFKQ